MTSAGLLLLCALVARVPEPSVLSLLPKEMSAVVHVQHVSTLLRAFLDFPLYRHFSDILPAPFRYQLSTLENLKLGELTAGLGMAWFPRPRLAFVVLLRTQDGNDLISRLRAEKWTSQLRIFQVRDLVAITQNEATELAVRGLANGEGESLEDDPLVNAFWREKANVDVTGYLDLDRTIPLRGDIEHPKDVGSALLFSHLLWVLSDTPTLRGELRLQHGLALKLSAPARELPKARQFAAPAGPTLPVLQMPEGVALRLSLTRDLLAFWRDRDALVPESSRGGFAEFRTNFAILLGVGVEEAFAKLGGTFDFYISRHPTHSGPKPTHRFPTAAGVFQLLDANFEEDLVLAFQEAVGLTNTQAAMNGKPRLLLETERHRDITLHVAHYPPRQLGTPGDDRIQLAPTLTIHNQKLILTTHPSLARRLIDQLLDEQTEPRLRGDHITIMGAAARDQILDAKPYLASRHVLDSGESLESAHSLFDRLANALTELPRSVLNVGVADGELFLELRVDTATPLPEKK